MADDTVSPRVDEIVSQAADLPTEASKTKEVDTRPSYKMMPDSKIPVSKNEGSVWKSRRESAKQAMSSTVAAWQEAESYYSLGQDTHREDSGGDRKGNIRQSRNIGRRYSSTENIVYSNVNAMVPAILAKNPQAEVTAFLKQLAAKATVYEHLVNRLAVMKYAPGFNLKPKLRKAIVRCEISNEAWIMVGYTQKQDSADQARQSLIEIGTKLASKDATTKDIEELEGQLQAIEETVDLLNPAGPFVRTFSGRDVLVDPNSVEDDFSDAQWMMVMIMLPTKYLLAKYAEKDESGQYTAIYNNQFVMSGVEGTNGDEHENLNNFKLIKDGTDYRGAGYDSKDAFDRAKMTKCRYVFDRVKRRFMLFDDNNWTWPIWVYDDPYQLPNFFPLYRLQYHTDPNRNRTKGEVSFYLDQQDELNDINSELNRMRTQILNKVLYDSRYIDKDEFDKWIKGGDQMAYGVKTSLPEGMKITDVIMAPPLPNMQYKELFDKTPIYQVVDRISSSNDILRGAQFKTNTTNDAVGVYNSIQNQRIDEKIDAIEDFSGDVFYAIMFLCGQFMTQDEVTYILGDEAVDWAQMAPDELRRQFNCTVLGGSTQKPTSASKKDQALKISQIMGQFANASPYVVVIMLKAMEQAFDDIVITADDWQQIIDSIEVKMQQGAGAGGPGDTQQPGAQGQPPQEQEQPQPGDPANGGVETPGPNTPPAPANNQEKVQLEHAIQMLTPQAQKAIAAAVQKGVPVQEAFVEVSKNPQSHAPAPQPGQSAGPVRPKPAATPKQARPAAAPTAPVGPDMASVIKEGIDKLIQVLSADSEIVHDPATGQKRARKVINRSH